MAKILLLARVVAAAPLLYMGYLHVSGSAAVGPMLEGLALPQLEHIERGLPWAEVAAGALLLLGVMPRLGALVGLAAAGLTAYAQNHHAWEGAPPQPAALVVAGLCALVLLAGGGGKSKSSGGGGSKS